MKHMTVLAIFTVFGVLSGALAVETNCTSVKRIDASDLLQQSNGSGTHYVCEKGHENTPFTGIATRTYPDGRKTMTEFKNGKGNGRSILWHANGKKAMQVTLVDDRPHGVLIKWDKTGAEVSRIKYVKGKEVSTSP